MYPLWPGCLWLTARCELCSDLLGAFLASRASVTPVIIGQDLPACDVSAPWIGPKFLIKLKICGVLPGCLAAALLYLAPAPAPDSPNTDPAKLVVSEMFLFSVLWWDHQLIDNGMGKEWILQSITKKWRESTCIALFPSLLGCLETIQWHVKSKHKHTAMSSRDVGCHIPGARGGTLMLRAQHSEHCLN